MLTVAAFFVIYCGSYLYNVLIFTFLLFTARQNGAQLLVVIVLFSLMLVMGTMMFLASAHMAFAGMLVSPIFSIIAF